MQYVCHSIRDKLDHLTYYINDIHRIFKPVIYLPPNPHRHMKRYFAFVYIILVLFSCGQNNNDHADKIYFNAKIWTGDSSDAWADAMATKGNEILYIGKDYAAFKGNNTEMIDLGGKLMLPGFIDNHTHFLSGGYNLSSVDLRKAKTKQEFISLLKEFCQQRNDNRW